MGRIVDIVARVWRRLVGIVDRPSEIERARASGVRLGEDCRLFGVEFGSEPYLVTLGDHVSASNVAFITHDGGVWVFRDQHPDIDVIKPIKVGDNVFLGYGVIVLPGVTIGDNVIVGAGAVVTRDIPSDCVAAGIPARPIRSLAEYWTSIEASTIPTKGLSAEEKRRYLTDLWDEGSPSRPEPS